MPPPAARLDGFSSDKIYPIPFTGMATIRYSLTSPAFVRLHIMDAALR
ncbi:MAG: hypothetical protein IH600_02410 [Bacteroidetes bacterium]|nr:hypothetical protein [Bacteroidota bacterium]